jgi:hypothetical protein
MVACVDGAADVHASANGPVLLEVGVVAFDRGSVGALLLPDLVCAAITLVASILCCADVLERRFKSAQCRRHYIRSRSSFKVLELDHEFELCLSGFHSRRMGCGCPLLR